MKISKKKVELLMAEKGMSYTDLNLKLGRNRSFAYRCFGAENRPKTVGLFARALGVPVSAIIDDEE